MRKYIDRGNTINKGIFITIEGIDGAGKTTQAKRLADYLKGKGLSYLCTREPGGTSTGDKIREILLDKGNHKLCGKAEVLLYAAARAQLVEEVIRPALDRGKMVISDRYVDSSIAYQAFGQGENPDFIRRVNEEATGSLYPHLTLILDLDPEEGINRLQERLARMNTDQDRIESKKIDYHHRVRQGYLFVARLQEERVKVIGAHREEEAVHRDIVDEVEKLLVKMGITVEG